MITTISHDAYGAIPTPSFNKPYVYLSQIVDINSDIWQTAANMVKTFNSSQSSKTAIDRRTNAIKYLHQIATTQRNNEIALLQQEKDRLKEQFQNTNDKEIISLIKQLTDFLNQFSNNQTIDYYKYTNLFNKLLDKSDSYNSRLERLKENLKNSNTNLSLLKDINEELRNTFKLLKNEHDELLAAKYAYSKIMNEFIVNYVNEHKEELQQIFNDKNDNKLFIAWLIRLEVRFRAYLEKTKGLKTIRINEQKYNTYKDTLNKAFIEYSDKEKILNITDEDKKNLLDIANNMGISFYKDLSDEQQKHIKDFINLPTLSNQTNITDQVFIKGSVLKHYSIAERLNIILPSRFDAFIQSGGSNMGDDSLGAITFFSESTIYDKRIKEVENALKEIDEAITKFAALRSDRENFRKNNKEFNRQLESIIRSLNKNLKKNEQVFLIHQSDKFYTGLEEYKPGSFAEFKGLKGRTIAILNYIDIMYNLVKDFGIGNAEQFKQMPFIALNLGEDSPANSSKNILEDIFTRAASLIMFDDIQIMVKEATTKQLKLNNVKNIHLYRLQSIFVPASYIIEETAKYLEACPIDRSTMNAAVPKIEVGENIYSPLYEWTSNENGNFPKKYNDFMSQTPKEKWNTVKNYMASQTLVSIHFFLNFANFISQIEY